MSNHTIRLDWDTMVEQRIEPAADTMTKDQTITLQAAEIERLRGLVDACAIYLKEDETPAQRIERERADTDAVLKILLKEKREVERLREMLQVCMDKWIPFREVEFRKRVREALGE